MAELSTIDLYGVADFLPGMPVVKDRPALVQRLARRLQTERGILPWWPDFGTDLRQFILSKVPPQRVEAAAIAECRKDEQVVNVRARAAFSDAAKTITLAIEVEDDDGPFAFTLAIDEAAANLIALQEGT